MRERERVCVARNARILSVRNIAAAAKHLSLTPRRGPDVPVTDMVYVCNGLGVLPMLNQVKVRE